jgi:hypothetical protein
MDTIHSSAIPKKREIESEREIRTAVWCACSVQGLMSIGTVQYSPPSTPLMV